MVKSSKVKSKKPSAVKAKKAKEIKPSTVKAKEAKEVKTKEIKASKTKKNGLRQKAFVTGGSGLVGSAVVRKLLAENFQVSVLTRQVSASNLKGLDVNIINGSLTDTELIKKSVEGKDAVFHVAADFRMWASNAQEMMDTNVGGTETVMRAALAAGCKKIVHTSSAIALAISIDGSINNEDTPMDEYADLSAYRKSKIDSERLVKDMVKKEKLPAVIVNPTAPIGPRDVRPTASGRMILEAAKGKALAYVNGGVNIVHVDDVASGHVLAYHKGKIGESYLLSGENLTVREILTRAAAYNKKPAPKVRLPKFALMPLALAFELAYRILPLKGEPIISTPIAKHEGKFIYVSNEKAKRELGFKPRNVDIAIKDSVDWFCDNGYCKRA